MENLTPAGMWAGVLAVASAIVLISNALEKILKAWKAAKAPNEQQNARLEKLEAWQRKVDAKLDNDYNRLGIIEDGNCATQRALLALLAHGLDGNNVEQMQDAKEELQNYLINRNKREERAP